MRVKLYMWKCRDGSNEYFLNSSVPGGVAGIVFEVAHEVIVDINLPPGVDLSESNIEIMGDSHHAQSNTIN